MKSMTYPYVYERVGPLIVMRDGDASKPRRIPRKSEVVAFGISPAEVLENIKPINLGHHFISHLHTLDYSQQSIRQEYKQLGYRALAAEEFFVHSGIDIPEYKSSPKVRRVTTQADSDKIKRVRRNRKAIRDEDLENDDAPHRLYAVIDGIGPCGWVGSVKCGDQTWIADLFVLPEYRGRGYGRALMSTVTKEDRRLGYSTSVLLASTAGARLYPHIGYEHIGTLQLLCKKR